jgi:hypothetical protein
MPYTVTGTPKGKRNETSEQYWEYVEVDIPVLDDGTAPVAIIWQDGFPTNPPLSYLSEQDKWKSQNWFPDDGEQMTRYFAGEHYLRDGSRRNPSQLAASLNPKDNHHFLHVGTIHHGKTDMPENPVSAVPYRDDKFISSDYNEMVAKLQEKASRYIIVDNELFERSSEPVIIVVTYRTDSTAAMIPRIVPKHRLGDRAHTYPIHAYEEVVQTCNDHLRNWRDDTPEVTMERAPTILLDEAFAHDNLTDNLLKSVRTFLARHEGDDRQRLGSVDPHYGIAYLNMKLAYARFEESGDLSAVEEWASVLVQNHPREVEYTNLTKSYEDYVNRPVSVMSPSSRGFKP